MAVSIAQRPLAPLTTWRVGGPALRYAEPASVEDLLGHIDAAEHSGLPWFVMGRGSNLLVADAGFAGLALRMCGSWHAVEVGGRGSDTPSFDGDYVLAQSGASSSAVVSAAMAAGLGGIAFLSSIPGSVGGAVFMNAGAHGAQTSEVLLGARILQKDGTIAWKTPAELGMRYRHCALQGGGGIVLEAAFRVRPQPAADIRQEILELARWRRERQPREPSAGSVFRNPPGDSAGRLIEAVGLKGVAIGGAQVSPIHANFIINTGSATARDILALIHEVQDRVAATYQIELIPEVRGVGLVLAR